MNKRLDDPHYERDKKRRQRARKGGTTAAAFRPFVGIDGEGGNVNGRHEYLLLRAGEHVLDFNRPLQWRECLTFLADLPKNVNYVGYFFDYDVTMMLRGCREERIRRLMDRQSRMPATGGQPFAVEIDGFFVEYMPRKEFKVRRGKEGPYTVISDVGSFFQCAFLKAIQSWNIGTEEQWADIAEGKAGRADFESLTDETRRYNILEIDLLEQLMEAFRSVCVDVGYVPAKWQGPGYMATAMFRKHGIPSRKNLAIMDNKELMSDANAAYYGGRFEVSQSGPVDGPIYQYDICSAYPAALLRMPCLVHGEWRRNGNAEGLYLARGRFIAQGPPAHFYGFPIRRENGIIYYPRQGNGYYWSPEINAARHQQFHPQMVWQYIKHCDCDPFGWIREVYAERIRLGKSARGIVLKLGLNSLYGKTAQSIGAATYANPIWAGLITAITRAQLLDIICADPKHRMGYCGYDVLMLATDGVFTTSPRSRPGYELSIGKALGDWELDTHDNIFIIQPGLYFTNDNTKPKTRGLPQSRVIDLADEFRNAWHTRQPVAVSLSNFIGLRQALARNKFATLAGTWQSLTKDVSWDLSSKRDMDRNLIPYPGGRDVYTVPYDKSIGAWRDAARLELLDQPDWADTMGIE